MKLFITVTALLLSGAAIAQQYPNNNFNKWNEWGCPESWYCNNDADCKGKVTKADKIKGGVKLAVMHCFNPEKEDRSNNVNISCDDLSAKIPKGKKVKVSIEYSFTPVGNDAAYIKIDADFDEEVNNGYPAFFYNNGTEGFLSPGTNQKMICYLNFTPAAGQNYIAPQACNANSIRTAFGIMPAKGMNDVHKNSTLIINYIKFEIE